MSDMRRGTGWFLTRRGGYQIVPCGIAGWLVVIGYLVFVAALTPLLGLHNSVGVAVWLISIFAATAVFSLIVSRTSVSAED